MFLVVIPQCNSMEMNSLSTFLLQMRGGNQSFKIAWGEISFAILPAIYFGVLSQISNISSLFTLVFRSCNTINDSYCEGKLPEGCSKMNCISPPSILPKSMDPCIIVVHLLYMKHIN